MSALEAGAQRNPARDGDVVAVQRGVNHVQVDDVQLACNWRIQRALVAVTLVGIGKSVTVTDCHSIPSSIRSFSVFDFHCRPTVTVTSVTVTEVHL